MKNRESPASWRRVVATRTNRIGRRANVAMLHPGRCGSTVLGEMLDEHPQVVWARELFEGKASTPGSGQPGFARAQIEASCRSRRTPYYGFETKYLAEQEALGETCINMELGDYVDLLRHIGFSKFILLHRRNYLRRAISVAVARRAGAWHSQTKVAEPVRAHIDVNAFQTGSRIEPLVDAFRRMDNSYEHALHVLAPDDPLMLVYEDDILHDPGQAYRKVCRFLGIEPRSAKVVFERTNPFAYREIVTNFDDVIAVLQETPYEWMLDD